MIDTKDDVYFFARVLSRAMTRNADEAEDFFQEAAIVIMSVGMKYASLSRDESAKVIRTSVKHRFIDLIRRRDAYERCLSKLANMRPLKEFAVPDGLFAKDFLESATRNLPARPRHVLRMMLENKTVGEMGAELSLSETTILRARKEVLNAVRGRKW